VTTNSNKKTDFSNAQEALKTNAYYQPRDLENRGKRQLTLEATVELKFVGN
jgi:hypothetical protein